MPTRTALALLVVVVTLASCRSDGDPTPMGATTSSPVVEATTTTTIATTTSSRPEALSQPAIWPAAGVVFDMPEEAARDFVTKALGVPAVLGTFRQGDSSSGEIDVFSPGEGGGRTIVRGVLLLRRLGPANGWFILGAVNENASITAPEPRAQVRAAPLTIAGKARGFEGTVVVTAFVAGNAKAQLASVITSGGSMATPDPYRVTLDLTTASPGDVVAIVVRGDTGLETDPGEFGAIAVTISR